MRTVGLGTAGAICLLLLAGCHCATCRYQYGGSPYGQYQVAPNCEGPCSPFRNSYYYQRGPCERALSDCPCELVDAAGLACVDLCDCFRYTCGNQYVEDDSDGGCDPSACDADLIYEPDHSSGPASEPTPTTDMFWPAAHQSAIGEDGM